MKKTFIFAITLSTGGLAQAQENPQIKISAYLETYYGYDFNKPADNNRPGFIYSHNRHNEVNLNLGFIKGSYNTDNLRANLAVMAGTYSNANLSAEPGVLKNIYEANAGIKLSKKANLWLDAGIFSSHIGFESAISKDCWVLTRNISSENTPYYESGAKLTYTTSDGKLTASALYLNGWQRITRQNGNSKPAGGLQLTWKPTSNIAINYSNYLGTEGEDSIGITRFYHNLYSNIQLDGKLGLILGIDFGTQQIAKNSSSKKAVISPVAIVRYKFNPKWATAARFEYYEDEESMIIASGSANGFKTKGYSLNIDYLPLTNTVVRLEGKVYDSKDKNFTRDLSSLNHNATITASIALSF